jgi:hypothetical protein
MIKFTYDPSRIDAATLDAIHKTLGRSLERWQHVETALYVLTHCLMGTSHATSSIVFFHIKSAENRLSLIDKLCLQHLKQRAYGGNWKDLRTLIADHIKLRNGIAHFELSGLKMSKLPTPAPTKFPIVISAHQLDVDAHHSGAGKGLYLESIEATGTEFTELANNIARFTCDHVPHWRQHVTSLPRNLVLVDGI